MACSSCGKKYPYPKTTTVSNFPSLVTDPPSVTRPRTRGVFPTAPPPVPLLPVPSPTPSDTSKE